MHDVLSFVPTSPNRVMNVTTYLEYLSIHFSADGKYLVGVDACDYWIMDWRRSLIVAHETFPFVTHGMKRGLYLLRSNRYLLYAGNVLIETCMKEKKAVLALLASKRLPGDGSVARKVWSFLCL